MMRLEPIQSQTVVNAVWLFSDCYIDAGLVHALFEILCVIGERFGFTLYNKLLSIVSR